MADVVFQTIGRWAAAAICAAAISLAQAAPHAASVSFRQPEGFGFGGFFTRPALGRQAGGNDLHMARSTYPDDAPSPSTRAGSPPRRAPRMFPPVVSGGIQYRPVSESARNVSRPPGASAYMRAGSIRDAVTRYNEERESGHAVPRPPSAGARTPDPSLYRN